MSRRIIETELQASQASSEVDSYVDKIMKYIPSEAVGVWITIKSMVEGQSEIPQSNILWVIFAFSLFLTFAYIKYLPSEAKKQPKVKQALLSVGAFIVWAIAIGGEPFKSLGFYHPVYGSILMVLYTAIIPLIPLEKRQLT